MYATKSMLSTKQTVFPRSFSRRVLDQTPNANKARQGYQGKANKAKETQITDPKTLFILQESIVVL